jgi:hypothetical protein
MKTWEGCDRKWSWFILRFYNKICLEELIKTTKDHCHDDGLAEHEAQVQNNCSYRLPMTHAVGLLVGSTGSLNMTTLFRIILYIFVFIAIEIKPSVMWQRCEANRSPSSSAEVQNVCSYSISSL